MIRNLLLISNSTNAGEDYLAWTRTYIRDFLARYGVRKVLFIPYAGVNLTSSGVDKSFDLYEDREHEFRISRHPVWVRIAKR